MGQGTTWLAGGRWRAYDVGIADPFTQSMPSPARDARYQLMAALGARWVRTDVYWPQIETARGVYDWSQWDQVVSSLQSLGLLLLPVVQVTPQWCRPSSADDAYGPSSWSEQGDYAAFCAAFASRYSPWLRALEVWNEPNLVRFWTPRPDPVAFTDLVHRTHDAVHAAAPGVQVISGGLGGSGMPAPNLDQLPYIEACLQHGLGSHCDGIAVHPYPNSSQPGVPQPTGTMWEATQARTALDRAGHRTLRLWGTETGAPTAGAPSVTEAQQAALLRDTVTYWFGPEMHDVGPLMWYTLDDNAASPADPAAADRELYFGLRREGGGLKPAAQALTSVCADTTPGPVKASRYVMGPDGMRPYSLVV